MKIVCLTEGGQEFGYGHIIRCVSIAQAFEEFSWQVDFVIDADHDVTDLLAGFAHRICNWRKGINLDDYSLVIVDSYAANYAELITVIKGKPVLF